MSALAVSAVVPQLQLPEGALDRMPESGPVHLLLVGTDRRAGLPEDVVAASTITGERADVVMLVRVPEEGAVSVLSIPRDVRVTIPGHGSHKLAVALAYGHAAAVTAVRAVSGQPVHHYAYVDFAGLRALVDALGGLALTVQQPLRDPKAELDLPEGVVSLDGDQALAYVRSRNPMAHRDGAWRPLDPGDQARIERQQQLAGALWLRLREAGPWSVWRAARATSAGVRVDSGMSAGALVRLASRSHAATSLRLCVLPTRQPERAWLTSPFPPAHQGSLGLREMDREAAPAVLAAFTGAGSAAACRRAA